MDILISEDLQSPAFDRLEKDYQVVRRPALWKDIAHLHAAAMEARTLVVRNQTQVTAELLGSAPKLIAVARVGVGLDNIDVTAASRLGVVVVAPLDANATSVAELAFGLILGLARKLPQADRSTKRGGWDRKGCTGIELERKTLGICGFGRIGRLVALRARAFGMPLLVFDPFVKAESPALRETGAILCGTLAEVLQSSDFITVHLPLTSETRHLFNARTFASMKQGAYFINTSRGGVVDEAALLQILRQRRLAGAALDVRETEPPVSQSDWETLDNVILTPHIGAFTVEAQIRTFEAVAQDLNHLLSGEPAVHFVNFARSLRGPA